MAAGSGSRMGASVPKQFLKIGDGGLTILETSVGMFEACEAVDEILVVSGESFLEQTKELAMGYSKVSDVVCGGKLRQDSVRNGLAAVACGAAGDEGTLVLVHDAARPFVTQDVIMSVIKTADETGAVVPVVPVKDTIRMKLADDCEETQKTEAGSDMKSSTGGDSTAMSRTLPRETLFSVQTPQGFDLELLRMAYDKAYADGFVGTDDAGIVEYAGHAVSMCQGDYANIKITTKVDLPRADSIGSSDMANENPRTRRCSARNSKEGAVNLECGFRIGHGYDVHQLVEGRKLILCGVDIPHELGLLGHSDADVALHALMDAMLGAAALGDIGKHFPDTDEKYRGISSMKLLQHVVELLRTEGFFLVNADITIIAQRPKIAGYIPKMRENIASVIGCDVSQINIKGTTTEKLGFAGREEGIASEAVCILIKK